MRGATVRLIYGRELRDLLRDRRWLFMLLGLPAILYPAFGAIGILFALATVSRPLPVGVVGIEHLPRLNPSAPLGPTADLTLFTVLPASTCLPADVAVAIATARERRRHTADPPLIQGERFAPAFGDELHDAFSMPIVELPSADRTPLDEKRVDAVLVVHPGFAEQVARGETAELEVWARDGDELSRLAARRVGSTLTAYRAALRQARFLRHGLSPEFNLVFRVRDADTGKPMIERTSDELRDALIKFLPFMLVMWSMAGALYPAIDLCAGEKERGTMETLLISPAARGEIVAGKYLAVWTLASVTALWNLVWMGGGTFLATAVVGLNLVRVSGLVWCAVLILPLASLFSGLCLALGAYARSTKEGQYYLMPIFLGTIPLVALSLTPGMDLTLGTSLIPVTGLCLLLQRLMQPVGDGLVWPYFAPTLASLSACSGLALWWAVAQFHREQVLFREADSTGMGERFSLWLRGSSRNPAAGSRG